MLLLLFLLLLGSEAVQIKVHVVVGPFFLGIRESIFHFIKVIETSFSLLLLFLLPKAFKVNVINIGTVFRVKCYFLLLFLFLHRSFILNWCLRSFILKHQFYKFL